MQGVGRIAGHVLLFAVCTVGCTIAVALIGGIVGSVVGESLGSAEGEGFIGFLYGVYSGAGIGVIAGFFAYLYLRRMFRGPQPDSVHAGR